MNPEERVKRMLAGARGDEEVTGAEWDSFSESARRSIRVQRFVAAGVGLLLIAAVAIGATTIFDGNGNKGLITPVGPTGDGESSGEDALPPPPTAPPSGVHALPPIAEREIWLVDPETNKLSWGTRTVPDGGDPLTIVLEDLFRGPRSPDLEVGVVTEIPEGTELMDTEIFGSVAHIVLSSEFDDAGTENPQTKRLREAQVVFTATQIEGVERVRIFVEQDAYLGKTVPVGRGEYDDVAPPIVVEMPKMGAEVTSPLTVSGTAMVFEATVSIRLQSSGKKIFTISEFATATCGGGCRGEFSKNIEFKVDDPAEARLTVYEESAEDGSSLHEVSIPITLLPDE